MIKYDNIKFNLINKMIDDLLSVVDDEESVAETLVQVLSIHGYRVITAASGETQRKPSSG